MQNISHFLKPKAQDLICFTGLSFKLAFSKLLKYFYLNKFMIYVPVIECEVFVRDARSNAEVKLFW